MNRWLLPEDIADVLPSRARKIEELRRRSLDLYQSYGYELVSPPLLEFLHGADLMNQLEQILYSEPYIVLEFPKVLPS